MSLALLGWLFTSGVLLHNLEEGVYLPAWSQRTSRWYRPVSIRVFRFAAVILSIVLILLTLAGTLSHAGGVGAYLMAGYALAMLINVFVPHLLATGLLRRYMPGTATAVLFNLPLGLLYLHLALQEGFIEWRVFRWAGPLVVIGLLALMPLLFALGRRIVPLQMGSRRVD